MALAAARDPGADSSVLRLRDVVKTYVMGSEEVHALSGVSLSDRRERIRRNHGAVRLGQVDPDEHHRLPRRADQRATTRSTAIESADKSEAELADIRNREIGFVFQRSTCSALAPAQRGAAADLRRHRQGRAAQAGPGGTRAGRPGDRMAHRPNELSGGQRQRVAIARALVSIRRSSWPTSRPATWTPRTGAEIMQMLDELHASGQTIIVVTHEDNIAAHASRTILLRDGKIESDLCNANPVRAPIERGPLARTRDARIARLPGIAAHRIVGNCREQGARRR